MRGFVPGTWDLYGIRGVVPFAEGGARYLSLPESIALVAIIPK